jgi:hypothetical protein
MFLEGSMNLRFTLLMLTFLSCAANLPAQAKCAPLPVLQIFDVRTVLKSTVLTYERAIQGTASIDGKPLRFADVRLYSGHKLFRHETTNAQGDFLLENLPLGRYRLKFKGLGIFDIEVMPPHTMQQSYYSFSRYHGCLDWGLSSD